MSQTKRELRAANLLSLFLVGIGLFFLIQSITRHREARREVINQQRHGYGTPIPDDNTFIKRYILCGSSILLGVAVHFAIRRAPAAPLVKEDEVPP